VAKSLSGRDRCFPCKAGAFAGNYRVKGRVHSRAEGCRKNGVRLQHTYAAFGGHWRDPAPTENRGKFSIRVPQSEEGRTFRAVAEERGAVSDRGTLVVPGPRCKVDKSPRFTPPHRPKPRPRSRLTLGPLAARPNYEALAPTLVPGPSSCLCYGLGGLYGLLPPLQPPSSTVSPGLGTTPLSPWLTKLNP
jgi:hypothetical protein